MGITRRVIHPCVMAALLATACAAARPLAPTTLAGTQEKRLRVFSAIGMRQVVLAVAPNFERRTGYRLEAVFHSGGRLIERLASGERFDVLLAPHSVIERLLAAGQITNGSVFDVAASNVSVAVREGAPDLNISSVAAFRETMLSVQSIACPDPRQGGSSGVHIAEVFNSLGISENVKPKLVLASTPDVPGTLPGDLLASGRAEVAIHQTQELLAVPGIRVVGPLPPELQARFIFTFAISSEAQNLNGAREFAGTLRSSVAIIRKIGMEPIR